MPLEFAVLVAYVVYDCLFIFDVGLRDHLRTIASRPPVFNAYFLLTLTHIRRPNKILGRTTPTLWNDGIRAKDGTAQFFY